MKVIFPTPSAPTAERKTGSQFNWENAEAILNPTPPVAVRMWPLFDDPSNNNVFSPFHIQSKFVPPITNGRVWFCFLPNVL